MSADLRALIDEAEQALGDFGGGVDASYWARPLRVIRKLVDALALSAPPVDPARGQCPDCGSANIGGNGHYREGDRTQRELMTCEDCQHEWRPDAPLVDLRPLSELVAKLREESDRHQNIARHTTDDGERDVASVLAYSKQRTASRLEAVLAPLSGARQDEKENGKG